MVNYMQICENFISYRRSDTSTEVALIYNELIKRGFLTYCDIRSMESGKLHENLKDAIDKCTNFILVLKEKSLERCTDKNDWVRKEIQIALEQKKNIICIFVDDFAFPSELPSEINDIRLCSGLKFDLEYFDAFIDRMVGHFLIDSTDVLRSDNKDFIIIDNVLIKYVGLSKKVNVPEGITSIGREAFKNKTKISTICLPNTLVRIEYAAFERCIGLLSIILPDNLENIEEKAFLRCYNLKYISFNDKLIRIDEEAFGFCCKIRYVQLGSGVKYIASSAFNNCNKLERILVSEDNNNFQTYDGILYNKDQSELIRCPENYGLDIINVPHSVKLLKEWSFSRCVNVINIILPGELHTIQKYAFQDCINILALTLGDKIEKFDISALDGWCNYQKIIVGKNFNPQIKYYIEQKICEKPIVKYSDVETELVMIKTTFESNEEATKMAKMLLSEHLIAAAQVNKLNVFYSWNDELCNEDELELSCITRGGLYKQVERFIMEHHSYNLCQIVCLPITQSSENFEQWILECTEKER